MFDRQGWLSEFLRDFHGVMGRFGSSRDGVEQTKFWSAQDGDAVALGDIDTVIAKVAYTLANPVKDFIVPRPEAWIGVMTPVATLGSGMGTIFARPKRFFDPEGWTSEMVIMGSDYPHEFYDLMPLDTFRRKVAERVEAYVADADREVKAGRRRWSGVEKVKKASVWHAADVPLRREVGHRSGARKRVAAATKGRVLAMLASLLAFRKARLEAWQRFRSGLHDTLFPPGTWFSWRFYGARREPGVAVPLAAPS